MPDTSPTPVDSERLHQLVGLAYLPAVKAINAAMDELELTYTAKKPIQGEASHKVLAYRVAVATVETLLAVRASIGPDSGRIRDVIAAALRYVDEHGLDYQAPPVAAALRAAGLLPGPDDIVVNREAQHELRALLAELLAHDENGNGPWTSGMKTRVRAALSQPHPVQEQQT